jgi:RNA polymerase sigma-70 factor (ECF subfamily)
MSPPVQEERFLALLKEHERIVYKVSYIYCGTSEDRKDLVQEILVQAWKSFARFDESFKFSTWLYRISLNVAISYHRSRKRKAATFITTNVLRDTSDNMEQSSLMEANHKLLYQFIQELDDLNKALMLLYLEENSYKEIAAILGITETNVATKINRIKNKLRNSFLEHKRTQYGT